MAEPPSKRGRTETSTLLAAWTYRPIDELVSDPDPSRPLGEDEEEDRGSRVVKLSEHSSVTVTAAFTKPMFNEERRKLKGFSRRQTCLKPDVQD